MEWRWEREEIEWWQRTSQEKDTMIMGYSYLVTGRRQLTAVGLGCQRSELLMLVSTVRAFDYTETEIEKGK